MATYNTRRGSLMVGAALALALTAADARAALLAYESWTYNDAEPAVGRGTGGNTSPTGGNNNAPFDQWNRFGDLGFGGEWREVNNNGGGNFLEPAGAGFANTYARVTANFRIGNFLDTTPTGTFAANGLLNGNGDVGADGTTVYVGFQARETTGNVNGYFEVELHRDDLGDPGRVGGVGDDVGGAQAGDPFGGDGFYLRAGTSNANYIADRDAELHQFVVRIDFVPGADNVSAYIDPTSAAALPNVVVSAGGNLSFDGLSVGTFNNGNVVLVDEIRVATTFAEALAVVPEPATAAAAGAVIGLLALRRRRAA